MLFVLVCYIRNRLLPKFSRVGGSAVMWLSWIVQFLFIPTILTQGQNIFDDLDVSQLRLCPFPRPNSLPLGCSCLVDGNYKSYLGKYQLKNFCFFV